MRGDFTRGAVFEFGPEDYIEGLWFVGNGHRDLLAVLWKTKDGMWRARQRWRHYDPTTMHKDPFNDNDSKSIDDLEFLGMEKKEILNKLHVVYMSLDRAMRIEGDTLYSYLPVQGDAQRLGTILREAPFAHVRKLSTQ